ncbi:fructosamine kinase family protein [Siminovitchia sediminis]|uniref:Fructosamine kinase family protein n=1 Tax=Siminovitchia sediminis TaxID=1274353 RepID=A0ABW4KAF4_9BACI
MHHIIRQALNCANDQTTIMEIQRVAGGSINKSFFVESEKRKYFIKHHNHSPNHFFELEADGLQRILATQSVSVPEVLAFSDEPGKAFLIMEWLSGEESPKTQTTLGENVAAMHQTFGKQHGLEKDTYVGIVHQPNGLYSGWLDYYRKKRLGAQLEQGIRKGAITGKRRDRLEKLLGQLERWIPADVPPSSLHGDLWGGNWLAGPGGDPYLIDPSFLYGDRHLELAFTELFGGFSSAFYEAYNHTYPLDESYHDIKPLYQLYYLLVHLNIFGEAYGGQVDAVLKRYVSD